MKPPSTLKYITFSKVSHYKFVKAASKTVNKWDSYSVFDHHYIRFLTVFTNLTLLDNSIVPHIMHMFRSYNPKIFQENTNKYTILQYKVSTIKALKL
jgi:hypothetical protein